MKIILPEEFFSILKDRHLLLDTNVFIDAFINPNEFGKFFNQLKAEGCTLVTIDGVISEFIKGAPTLQKLEKKREFVDEIIEEQFKPIKP